MSVAKKYKLNIELKNIKYSAFASQETYCFEATIYLEGVKVGTASNAGHGGPTEVSPLSLYRQLDEHAKTLPTIESQFIEGGLPVDPEIIIGDLMTEHLAIKNLKKDLKNKIVFTANKEAGVFTVKAKGTQLETANENEVIAHVKKHFDANEVLNFMPFDDAFKIYAEKTGLELN